MDLYPCDIPVMKLFVHNCKFYLYDTYTNYIINVTRDQFKELEYLSRVGVKRYITVSRDNTAYNDVICLLDKGLLRYGFVNMIRHAESEYVECMLQRHISDICLQVSRQCNFKCRYCLYTNEHGLERTHENINMKWDVAKSAIDYLYINSCDSERIGISFYGGEPFMNFGLIKRIVDYSSNCFFTKPIEYHATTNGSLLNDEIIDFIIRNNFRLAISFDGDEKIQNKHRRFGATGEGTYETVFENIIKIRRKNKEFFDRNISFIAVFFDDENQNRVISFFEKNGIAKDRVLLEDASLAGIDYIPVIDGEKMESPASGYNLFLDYYADKNRIPCVWHHNGPCIPGVKKLFVDTEGNLYPCEKIVEHECLTIGTLYKGIDIDKVISFMNIGRLSENDCKHCWAMRFCDICVASCNDINNKCINYEQKKTACYYLKQKTLRHMKQYVDLKMAF